MMSSKRPRSVEQQVSSGHELYMSEADIQTWLICSASTGLNWPLYKVTNCSILSGREKHPRDTERHNSHAPSTTVVMQHKHSPNSWDWPDLQLTRIQYNEEKRLHF